MLYCEEGEGHTTAALSLARSLAACGLEVVTHDALKRGLGRLVPLFTRDVYRVQVRWLRWSYGLEYLLFTRFAPTRAIGRLGLAFFGSRPLRRLIADHRPDLIVSTHPAVTNVLGFLRLRGRLAVPTVATITDFGVHELWAHRGIDLHLVMHERSQSAIERVAGPGSARVVEPIVAPEFLSPLPQRDARRLLGLPDSGAIAVVSGGGWGVGSVEATTEAALAVADLFVVCLSGRNEPLRRRLEQRFADDERVRVMPFTDQMPALLAAADVLVDATVGVTCLEALAAGCRVVVFGAPPGHSRDNAQEMAALGLAEAPKTNAELSELLAAIAAERGRAGRCLPAGGSVADAIIAVGARVQPVTPRRPALVGAFVTLAMLLFAGWTFASPIPYPLVAGALGLASLRHVNTPAAEVAVVVDASPDEVSQLAQAAGADGIHASFAVDAAPPPAVTETLDDLGDGLLPALPRNVGALHIRSGLPALARALGLSRPFHYLIPPAGFTLGDYLMANGAGGRPVSGAVAGAPSSNVNAGSIVVLDATGSYTRARHSLAALRALLSSRRLRGVSLEALLASTSSTRPTEPDRASPIAPTPTISSETTSPISRSGSPDHHSRARTGASPTGTNVVSA